MIAFDVSINGHHVCRAGVGDHGLLSVDLCCVFGRLPSGEPRKDEMVAFSISGSAGDGDCQRWTAPTIGVGAEVTVHIVEADTADPPDSVTQHPAEPPAEPTGEMCGEVLVRYADRTPDELRKLGRDLLAASKARPA